jgi:hypothetical protein
VVLLARRAAFAFAFAMVSLTGCALLLDTSGLTGGDGAGDGGAAAGEEGGALDDGDAPPPPVPPAAGDDAGLDAAPDASAICGATFFDSFDVTPLGGGWDSIDEPHGTLTIDPTDSVSPPSSLRVDMVAPPKTLVAMLTKTLPKTKNICCQVAMKTSGDMISTFRLDGRGRNYELRLTFGSGSQVATEVYYAGVDASGISHNLAPKLPYARDTWQHIVMRVALPPGAGTGTIAIDVDGKNQVDATIGSDAYDLSLDELQIGILYAENTDGPRTLRFDDVGCSVK